MPRGARPGERRGGRAKGTPNKATLEKLTIAQRVRNKSRRARKKLAIEILKEIMEAFYQRFVYHQPAFGSTAPNPNENEEKCLKYAKFTFQVAKALLPYQSPKFRAIRFTPTPEQGKEEKKTRITLRIFDKARDVGPERGGEDEPDGPDGSSMKH